MFFMLFVAPMTSLWRHPTINITQVSVQKSYWPISSLNMLKKFRFGIMYVFYTSKTVFLVQFSYHDVIVTSPHYKYNSGVSAIIVLTDLIFKSVKKSFDFISFMRFLSQKRCFWYILASMTSLWRHLNINLT